MASMTAMPKPSIPPSFDSLKNAPASSWHVREVDEKMRELVLCSKADFCEDEPSIRLPEKCSVEVKALPKKQQTEWGIVRVRLISPDFSYTQSDAHWRDIEFGCALVDIPDGYRPQVLLGDCMSDDTVPMTLFFDRC